MPKIEVRSEKVTTTILQLPKKDLLRALRSFREIHHNIVEAMESGRHISIFVEVPGGADWSNTQLEIDDYGVNLHIRYETIETDSSSIDTEGK